MDLSESAANSSIQSWTSTRRQRHAATRAAHRGHQDRTDLFRQGESEGDVAKPIASTMTRPRTNRDGERRCRIDTLGVMVVPMAAITENTVMNERTLTSHSGMISTTASRA